MQYKPILCLDFDGVLHSYTSDWEGADVIPDPPVSGAVAFIEEAIKHFNVHIYSSRSHQTGGIDAMKEWLIDAMLDHFRDAAGLLTNDQVSHCEDINDAISWPTDKPPAFLTLDDRAMNFNGTWPNVEHLLQFKPWNKR